MQRMFAVRLGVKKLLDPALQNIFIPSLRARNGCDVAHHTGVYVQARFSRGIYAARRLHGLARGDQVVDYVFDGGALGLGGGGGVFPAKLAIQSRQFRRNLLVMVDGVKAHQAVTGTLQVSHQCVVILLGDWVELVVVAPGAADGQPEKALAHHVNHVVEPVRFVLANVHRRMYRLAQPPEASAEDRLIEAFLRIETRGFYKVARDVFDAQLVVRYVYV